MRADGAESGREWYREPWPWLLMLPPALAVLGGLTMLYLAIRTPHALVVDDYARIEEATEQRFAEDARAAALGLAARLAVGAEAGRTRVTVALATDTGFALPAEIAVHFRHAARAELDRALVLTWNGARYSGITDVESGRYAVEVAAVDGAWRLGGVLSGVPAELDLTAPGRAR